MTTLNGLRKHSSMVSCGKSLIGPQGFNGSVFLFLKQAAKTLGQAAEPQASGPPCKTLHNKCSCSRASRGVKRALCRSGRADCASACPVVSCGRPGERPSHPAPAQGPDANGVHLQEYHSILRNGDIPCCHAVRIS